MGIEYIAVIAEEDYRAFKILVGTTLPRAYEMWVRVRERGKLRAMQERGAVFVEVEVCPEEFGAYCKSLKRPDFSITALDRCAREKVWLKVAGLPSLQAEQQASGKRREQDVASLERL